MVKILDRLIEAGILFLIVFTPLMFGSVHVRNYCVLAIVAFALVLIWMAKMILTGCYDFERTPVDWFIVAFLALVLFQLVPLPPTVMRTLSPNTYGIYKHTLDNYDTVLQENDHKDIESTVAGIALFPKSGSTKTWRPLSIYPHATKALLLKILAYLAVFYLIINNLRKREQLNRVVWAIVLVGFFEALYGSLEYFSGHQHIFFFEKVVNRTSLTGTYINGNHLAGYLGMAIPLSLGLLYVAPGNLAWTHKSARHDFSQDQKHLPMVIAVLALFMLVSLVFTGSRMGLISVLASLLLFTAILKATRPTHTKAWVIKTVILSTAILAVCLGVAPIFADFLRLPEELTTFGGRWSIWGATTRLWKDFALFGTGLGTFETIFPKYPIQQLNLTYLHAHNNYLEFLSDMGVTGFVVFATGIALFARKVFLTWKPRRNTYAKYTTLGAATGIFAICLHDAADFNMHIPANALLFFILLASSFAMANSRSGNQRNSGSDVTISRHKRLDILAIKPAVIAFVCAILVSQAYTIYLSDKLYRNAKSDKYTTREKISFLKESLAHDPGNALYAYELARLRELDAVAALRTATWSNPANARYWYALGLEGMKQCLPEAENALLKAVYLAPSQSTYRLAYGWHLLSCKGDLGGLDQLRQALALDHRDLDKILGITWRIVPSAALMRRILPEDPQGELRERLEDFLSERSTSLPSKGRGSSTRCPSSVIAG